MELDHMEQLVETMEQLQGQLMVQVEWLEELRLLEQPMDLILPLKLEEILWVQVLLDQELDQQLD